MDESAATAKSSLRPATTTLNIPATGIYANGFKAGISASDIFVVLERNGSEIAVLNLSYTVAKSLGMALKTLIEQLEQKSGHEIMTSDEVGKYISAPSDPAPT